LIFIESDPRSKSCESYASQRQIRFRWTATFNAASFRSLSPLYQIQKSALHQNSV